MKLEREMKKYYQEKLDGIKPSEFTHREVEGAKSEQHGRILFLDAALSVMMHSFIAAVLIAGYFQHSNESLLSGVFSQYAADLSIGSSISLKIETLSKEMIRIKNFY